MMPSIYDVKFAENADYWCINRKFNFLTFCHSPPTGLDICPSILIGHKEISSEVPDHRTISKKSKQGKLVRGKRIEDNFLIQLLQQQK